MKKVTLLLSGLALLLNMAFAQKTWVGPAGGGDWQVGANWSGGTAPGATDDVVLNTASNLILTNLPTVSILKLQVLGGTTAHLRGAAAATITITGDAGDDLVVDAASNLYLNGAAATIINLPAGATGSVSGKMGVGGAAHRITANAAMALVFQSGSEFRTYGGFTGNPFGNAVGSANSVHFLNGSKYHHRNGANPFALAAPAAVTVFATNSLFYIDSTSTGLSITGRTYGNFEVNIPTLNTVFGVGSLAAPNTTNMNNLIITAGSFGFWGNGVANIHGNLIIGFGQSTAPVTQTLFLAGINNAAAAGMTLNVNMTSPTGTIALAPGVTNPYFSVNVFNFVATATQAASITHFNIANGATINNTRSINTYQTESHVHVLSGGTLNFLPVDLNVAAGVGSFELQSGATLGIGATFGIMAAPAASGQVQTTIRNFHPGANYNYFRNQAGLCQVGTALPTTINGSLIMNHGPLTTANILMDTTTVNGVLGLVNGSMYLNANDLIVSSTGTIAGGSATSHLITNGLGSLIRQSVGSTATAFPVGFETNSYDPVTITNNGTVDDFLVNVDNLIDAVDSSVLVKRTWWIEEATVGGSNCDLAITYSPSAPVGASYNPANPVVIGHFDGALWHETAATLAGTTASGSGFNSFSPYTVGNAQVGTYYADTDGDTYGDANNSTNALNPPAGYVANADDCDDTNADINPDATEVCNNVDDNCNAETDEGLPPMQFYADEDGDTYGDPGNIIEACAQFAGMVTNSDDCDDSNPDINPNGTESCNMLDDDCDGTIDENGIESFTATLTHSCTNATGNKIVISGIVAPGAPAPYTYSKDGGANFQTSATFLSLGAATYTMVVKAANGCTQTEEVFVGGPMTLNTTIDSANCFGSSDGSVTPVLSGGYPAYLYSWSNGATTSSISGLAAGTYGLTVTDDKGCTKIKSSIVKQPALVKAVKGLVTNVSCFGGSNGVINVNNSGGTAPYTSWSWSNGATTTAAQLTGATAGNYGVTVTDSNGCTGSLGSSATTGLPILITVTQPPLLTVAMAPTHPKCHNDLNGSVKATGSGGTKGITPNPAYTFAWSAGTVTSASTNSTSSGLGGGTVTVTVTDAKGCTVEGTATLNNPTPVEVTGITAVPNGTKWNVTIAATGGTPNPTLATGYKYNRTTGFVTLPVGTFSTANPQLNVATGNYTFFAQDKNLCNSAGFQSAVPPTFMQYSVDVRGEMPEGGHDILLAPNPVRDFVNITFRGDDLTGQLVVSDVAGKIVLEQPAVFVDNAMIRLNTSDLSAGNYQVTFMADNGNSIIKRFVVVR